MTTEPAERLTSLRGELRRVLDKVRTLAIGLPALADLLDQLRGALADVPVVSLGDVGITVELTAGRRWGRRIHATRGDARTVWYSPRVSPTRSLRPCWMSHRQRLHAGSETSSWTGRRRVHVWSCPGAADSPSGTGRGQERHRTSGYTG